MAYLPLGTYNSPPCNLCELLLRDISSLLVTSQFISRSLLALRPDCAFSRDLTDMLDSIVAISIGGESRLNQLLLEAGAVLPATTDLTISALIAECFTRLPAGTPTGVLATEIIVNLRLLAQHIELKSHLVAETALLVGQDRLGGSLVTWSAEWYACGRALRTVTMRARTQAYIADLTNPPPPPTQSK